MLFERSELELLHTCETSELGHGIIALGAGRSLRPGHSARDTWKLQHVCILKCFFILEAGCSLKIQMEHFCACVCSEQCVGLFLHIVSVCWFSPSQSECVLVFSSQSECVLVFFFTK